ncbi:hypothetical protein RF55_17071, partial [Lasius niger]
MWIPTIRTQSPDDTTTKMLTRTRVITRISRKQHPAGPKLFPVRLGHWENEC